MDEEMFLIEVVTAQPTHIARLRSPELATGDSIYSIKFYMAMEYCNKSSIGL
jgi:hypothetical protein